MDKPEIVRAWCAARVGCAENGEVWKQCNQFPNYSVSNLGRIKNNATQEVLHPWKSKNGYMVVRLRCGDRHNVYVHRLIAEAFCSKPDGCDVVNHLDNDTTNNAAQNLCWCTQRDNVMHAMIQNRVRGFPNAISVIGEKDGVERRFRSYNEAAEYARCDSKILWTLARNNRQSADGTIWRVACESG